MIARMVGAAPARGASGSSRGPIFFFHMAVAYPGIVGSFLDAWTLSGLGG